MSNQRGNTKEISDLKQEIERLKRQVARLRKDNEKLRSMGEPEVVVEASPAPINATCPKCGSADLGEIETPNGKKFVSCRSCKKWRAKV